jgi:DNA-binding transcriptional MerR regulator
MLSSMHLQVDLRSSPDTALDIAEVARAAGVPASTLRFYEEKGLIRSIGRRGLRRLFEPAVLERLALIGVGRVAGFSLDEIAQMFDPDGRPRIDRQKLLARANELDAKIRELSKLRDGLRHAAACRAPSHMECPKFQCILRAVSSGPVRRAAFAGSPRPRRRSA